MSLVVHLTHTWGGGTQKYIDELCKIFPNEHHIINPQSVELEQVKCFHVHSTMVGANIGWGVLRLLETNKKIIMSIHDYQWLFPWCPNPTTEDFETLQCPSENVQNFLTLLNACDKVFFHTQTTLNRYEQFCGKIEGVCISLSHPCDIQVNYERLFIPKIVNFIHIGFLGGNAHHKGAGICMELARKMPNIRFHVYGCNGNPVGNVMFHGPYKDETITNVLRHDGIHMLLALSLSEETYCYALTRMINTGLPIVFLNRGAISERLFGKSERFFSLENFDEAIKYVNEKSPIDEGEDFDYTLSIRDSYKNIYE